jgi:septum formation topological specificity factor MinE
MINGNVFGQQNASSGSDKKDTTKSETKSSESTEQKPVGTYLDISHAREDAIRYDEFIRDRIYRLQVVVANFGEAADKSTLEAIQKEHVQGKKELFKRKYLNSVTILTKVKKDIRELLASLSTRYQTKANDILGLCAETLVDKEIGMGNRGDLNIELAAKTSKKITQNRIKLIIAYDQLSMGDKFKSEERLFDSVTHYRLAKLHGINILVDMAESESDKDKVKTQYKVDLSDGENLVSK